MLFENPAITFLRERKKWVLKNYIYQLQLEDRLDCALKALDEADLGDENYIHSIRNLLKIELRMQKKVQEATSEYQTTAKKHQEAAGNKHLEILMVFLAIMAIVFTGIAQLSTIQPTARTMIFSSLSVLMIMSFCLTFLANTIYQIAPRIIAGAVCAALIYQLYVSENLDPTPLRVSPVSELAPEQPVSIEPIDESSQNSLTPANQKF